MYCESCNMVYDGVRCPSCGNRTGRQPQPDDICFLTENEAMWARMLEDVLRQNGIEVWSKSTYGAGLVLKSGGLFERQRLYVRFARLQEARELSTMLFSEAEAE